MSKYTDRRQILANLGVGSVPLISISWFYLHDQHTDGLAVGVLKPLCVGALKERKKQTR